MSALEILFLISLVVFSLYSGMIFGRYQTNSIWEYNIRYHNSAKIFGENYLCRKHGG